MLPPIFELLKADAAVTALLGSPPRVYRHGRAIEGVVPPHATWSVINELPENTLSELPSLDRVTVQIDCYHPDDQGVVDLALAVRAALEPSACMTGMPVDMQEPDTGLYRIALQFDWLLSR